MNIPHPSVCGLLFHCNKRAQLTCGMWDLSTLTGDRTCIPCTGRWIFKLNGFRFPHIDISFKMRKMNSQHFHLQTLSAPNQTKRQAFNSSKPISSLELHSTPHFSSMGPPALRAPGELTQPLSSTHLISMCPGKAQDSPKFPGKPRLKPFSLILSRLESSILFYFSLDPFPSSSTSLTPYAHTHKLCAHVHVHVFAQTHTTL